MARDMKDSGIEWIGEIPRKWDLVKTKHCYSNQKVIVGENADEYERLALTLNGVIKRSKYDSTGLQPEAFNGYQILHKNELVFKLIDLENISTSRVGYSPYTGIVSPAYIVLHPNERKESRFGEYYFLSMWQREIFNHMGDDGVRSSLNAKDLMDTPYLRIPSSEKEIIVSFLDTQCAHIDSVIEKTRAAIEEYKKLKQAVITQAVTKGIRPNREMKDSETGYIGQIPIEWGVVKLRYLGICQNGISKGGEYFGSGFPFVSYSDVYKNMELPLQVDKLVESTEEEQDRYSVIEGDIFFTRTSETIEEIGFTSVCKQTIEKATFAGFLIRVRPVTQKLVIGFSKYYFRSEIHRQYFVKEMNLVTRASLGQELLKNLPVLVPSITEQSEIVAYLNEKTAAIDSLIQKREQLISELEAYKKSLIYEYVTGKKEVPQATNRIEFSTEFKIALLMCRILELTPCRGRTHLQKSFFALDVLLNLFSDTQYYRFQHGPYDINIEDYEQVIEDNGWVKVKREKAVKYIKTADFNSYRLFYNKVFGDKDSEIQRICRVFDVPTTKKAEKMATVLASWNDFLIDSITPTDEMIVNDIITNWTENKANINTSTWYDILSKLKEQGLIPKGFGKKTLRKEESKNAH